MTTRTDLVTKPGPNGPVILARRVWALLADVEKAVGLKPGTLEVSQGSYRKQTTYSGTTHTGGGALDVRVYNLTSAQIEKVVWELRRRNVAAWKRDKAHGGFAPHVHGIVMDEPDLGSGAKWQRSEYLAGRNGLSNGGPDYHPRPVGRPWPWAAPAYPGVPIGWGSRGDAVTALEKCFGLPVTGLYSAALKAKIVRWQLSHPGPWAKDRTKAGGVGPSLYAGIIARFWGSVA